MYEEFQTVNLYLETCILQSNKRQAVKKIKHTDKTFQIYYSLNVLITLGLLAS